MPSIRTKFIAEGEKEYKEALKSIDNGMKVLQSESKKLAAQFEDNADSAEALNAKNKNTDFRSEVQEVQTTRPHSK